MTKHDVLTEYSIRDGKIVSPGKFQGEAIYAPYFSEFASEGEELSVMEEGEGSYVSLITISEDDKQNFSELAEALYVVFEEDSQGFVSCTLLDSEEGAQALRDEYETQEGGEERETIPDFPEAILEGYIECALWSSSDALSHLEDAQEYSLDEYVAEGNGELTKEARQQMEDDCKDFWQSNHAMLIASELEDSQIGHDFWLTRNGHGAGFWDRGLPEDIGNALTVASKVYSSADLYIGDDKNIHHY